LRKLEFTKAQGAGNDFMLVNCLSHNPLEGRDLGKLAVRFCDRNFGIGGDGLVLILPSASADYRMQIINSDGSEAEMCGNATRCVAKYLFDRNLAGKTIRLETLAGIKIIGVAGEGYSVNMGAPALDATEIPVTGFQGRVVSQPLTIDGRRFNMTCVSMGNPHCVIFTDDLAEIPLDKLGPAIETHPAFPRKTNVEFAKVLSRDEVRVRVWERGAGITLACGTGACATLVAGVLNGLLDRKATVHLPGGDLLIEWLERGEVLMTGPAREVFSGEIELDPQT